VVDLSTDTTARCTDCNDFHRLIDATVNSVAVAGNCYRMCSFIVDIYIPARLPLSLMYGSLATISHQSLAKHSFITLRQPQFAFHPINSSFIIHNSQPIF